MSRFEQFVCALRSNALRPCIECNGAVHTYADLLEDLDRWQVRLAELGVPPGDVIAVRSDYSFSAIAAVLALLSRHAVVALIPRGGDAGNYLTDAHAQAVLDFGTGRDYRWCRLEQSAPNPLLDRLRDAGEGGIVIFTSGSTGRPKAALQSIERFLYKFRDAGRRFRTLAFLLFDHVAGLDTLFYTLMNGGALILADRRDPQSILRLIASHKVEVLPASPSFLRLLCATNDHEGIDLSSLRIITYGSEPMDSRTLQRLNERFPDVKISQKYGTTETGSPRSLSRSNDSLWVKFTGLDTKVIDDVLWIRSEGTILGYLNAPSPVDDSGWYCTGDLVDVDGEWLKFRGRVADIINVGGEKVAPAEVERVILELEFVSDVVVYGEPHPLMGQIPTARAALRTSDMDAKQAAQRIRMHCRQRLSSHKVPIRIDITTEPLANERQKARRRYS